MKLKNLTKRKRKDAVAAVKGKKKSKKKNSRFH